MLEVRMTPFELAIHQPDQFRATFDADADEYLRELGLEPESARRQVVKIVVIGQRSHLLKRQWCDRQESLVRVRAQREMMALRSKCELAKRRVTRLKRAFREVIELAESGDLRKNSLRWRFRKALRRGRKDGDLAVSSERELMAKYAGDLSREDPCVVE
jgi:hypothetical protein